MRTQTCVIRRVGALNHAIMRRNTIVGSVLITLSIVVAVAMLPDLVRYMKIRAM
jgi:hypothetical protein